jgi:hypothetical protein
LWLHYYIGDYTLLATFSNNYNYYSRSLSNDAFPTRTDGILIVGSGIGGLWLGACLAKFNITSLVLEQHYIAGGFQHTFWKGPYEFVPGYHYIANLPLWDKLVEKC